MQIEHVASRDGSAHMPCRFDDTDGVSSEIRTNPRRAASLHTRKTLSRAASLAATPAASHKSRSMLHHACLLCAAALHISPSLPRTSGWRDRIASVNSAFRMHGRSSSAEAPCRSSSDESASVAGALLSLSLESREISNAKSEREHWAKGLFIESAGCKCADWG